MMYNLINSNNGRSKQNNKQIEKINKMKNKLVCKVLNKEVSTTPDQFAGLCKRYGLTEDEMLVNHVSREGRNYIKVNNLSQEQVKEQFHVHDNVLTKLKCWKKDKPLGKRALKKLEQEQNANVTTTQVNDVVEENANVSSEPETASEV
jgi:hypothetical protein